jgi:polyphenol oxidase
MSVPIETITNESLTEKGFYWRDSGDVKVLVCKILEENGFANGFSSRLGGVSALPENSLNLSGFDFDSRENIEENRRRFLSTFNAPYNLSTVWQIHSDLIKTVDSTNLKETDDKFDAIISNLAETLIGVKTADCVPVLIGDSKTKAFAAIHAGWRGTVQSIVVKAINRMKNEFGTNPNDLICSIGPAAVSCYEVGKDVIEEFAANLKNSTHLFTPTKENHAFVDLHQANREQLVSCGVNDRNILTAPFCTMDRSDLFFSYREDQKKYGQTGRLLSVIGQMQ